VRVVVVVWGIREGRLSFQPKGLARMRKKPNRPRETPKAMRRKGDILPRFIATIIVEKIYALVNLAASFTGRSEVKYIT